MQEVHIRFENFFCMCFFSAKGFTWNPKFCFKSWSKFLENIKKYFFILNHGYFYVLFSFFSGCTRILTSTATPTYATIISPPTTIGGLPIAIPITTFTISNGGGSNGGQASPAGFPGKYIRLSPKPTSNPTLISSSPKSPVRRPRGDAKKCRYVYVPSLHKIFFVFFSQNLGDIFLTRKKRIDFSLSS